MEVAGADPEWAVGFLDECWWSRVALPTLFLPSPYIHREFIEACFSCVMYSEDRAS